MCFVTCQYTPLHVAAESGSTSAITTLLDEGADILYSNDDATFLDIIINKKFSETADTVVKHAR